MKIKKLASSLTRDKAEEKETGQRQTDRKRERENRGGRWRTAERRNEGDEAEGWPLVAKVNWQFNKFAKLPRGTSPFVPLRRWRPAEEKRSGNVNTYRRIYTRGSP